ncbi:MAG: D-alanyl-D-alanine carboxypeptidase/D-alanyl-D-alanine endopeptidase [Flavisolibacter sp.]
MKRLISSFIFSILFIGAQSQDISSKLEAAYKLFENDPQLRSAMASLYVIDAKTGKPVFDRNSTIGLAPASTQKIITAATAYELLGKDFRYSTQFGYYGMLKDGNLEGSLVIKPSGDPTLGSWRWKQTEENIIIRRITAAVKKTGIRSFQSLVSHETGWESETIPGGWVWDDIGNYYGAGAHILNWRENQYDLILKSGRDTGTLVSVAGTIPALYDYKIISRAIAAPKGTGDNAYIYFPQSASTAVVRGTIPVNENRFVISGAMPSSRHQLLKTLTDSLSKTGIIQQKENLVIDRFYEGPQQNVTIIHTEFSPSLDTISYWFLRRSINLYGEALAKTMAAKASKTASTSNGADIIRDHWSKKGIGIERSELNLHDGSGLSPLNRTTTHGQVTILQYARQQDWFDGYYHGFPEFNGMKMKSGTISGVKGFCGYHVSKNGRSYIFSFLVNNYNGSASALVQKMYKVLDVLK